MAIYHCRFKIHTRGKGAQASRAAAYRSGTRVTSSRVTSAVRAAAYRSGGKLEDLGGEVHDFRRKGGIVHNEIMAPEGAPAWVYNRSKLWNAVEAREDMSKRRDTAQLFREAELSIPRELSPAQRIALVERFVWDAFVSRGMIADIGIHCPKASDGGEQPHAHVMLTMREIGPNGFGNKRRDWNGASFFNKLGKPTQAYAREGGSLRAGRISWQDYCNEALAEAGSAAGSTTGRLRRRARGIPLSRRTVVLGMSASAPAPSPPSGSCCCRPVSRSGRRKRCGRWAAADAPGHQCPNPVLRHRAEPPPPIIPRWR